MAAGLGFKTFTTGEVLTAADTNGYLMQGILVFASSAARATAITSPQEGQYSYLKDTNALEYYDGAAWVGAPVGDITAVTAGKGLTGGGSSGDVTVSLATTAKGDLVAGSGASTAAVLTVGNNGETLVADSSTSTGLRYQAPVQANPVINSAMQIAQRGTSVALNATLGYSLDRWQTYYAGNLTVSRQSTNDTTNLPNIQYCARVQRNSGQTNTTGISFGQSFETINSIPFVGKTVTMSFYARSGANYSSASNALLAVLVSGTGTDQGYISGSYTGGANVVYAAPTLTTTWQRFTYSGTVATSATELALNFSYTPSGTAGANDYFEITGVQLEVGSVATPFHTYAGTIQGELAACQRYYYRQSGTGNNTPFALGYCTGSTTARALVPFPTAMRVAPTALEYSTLATYDGGTQTAITSAGFYDSSTTQAQVYAGVASGLTTYRPIFYQARDTSAAYIAFSAEL